MVIKVWQCEMLATNIIFSSKGRSLPNENLNMEDWWFSAQSSP